jgi:hypothetical protein
MTDKAPREAWTKGRPQGWTVQVMQLGPDAAPSFLYFKAAISDPVEAVAATRKLVSHLPRVTVRHVSPLSSADLVAIKTGEVMLA